MTELPIACSLTPAQRRDRRSDLLSGLVGDAVTRESMASGYRWRFETNHGLVSRMAQVIDAERECCRFLTFGIVAQPDLGAVALEVTGPEGTQDFLDHLIEEATL